ncbi:hypothetical protein L1987_21758 [Smallanthus sonchifolius]|uniref:Uncharacterized protein n=1 Tax=Smallanthus sonchifolius TaxID=185202 RepID=A0ACB9IEG2_9ASTR|nr:hypothetical protein L1987_21758 [Smallanthus sonchifolius]
MEDNSGNKSKRKARFRDINQLKGHLFHQHKLIICSLCLEGRKVFICEQKLYSKAQLKQHISTGDSEVDGTESERGGFQGHPLYKILIHFRQEHFLCEDEACLSKKFIVFTSESEIKVHNAQEHGGHLSRSKRNAVLQLPTSFTYRRSNEQENRRGRRNTFLRDLSESELSRAIEASLQTSSNSRYLTAVSHRPTNTPLEESAFPPLSTGSAASAQKPNGLPRNTMAEKLRRKNKKKVNVLNTGNAWPAATRSNNNNNHQPSSSSVSRPVNPSNTALLLISGQRKSTISPVLAPTRISHSTSAPNLVDMGSASDFPPV